jgi:hypothetical protein
MEKTKDELKEMYKIACKLRDEAKHDDRYACNTLKSAIQFWDKQSEEVQEAVEMCIKYESCDKSDLRALRGR